MYQCICHLFVSISFFDCGVSGIKCHAVWYRINKQEGNGSSYKVQMLGLMLNVLSVYRFPTVIVH